MRPAAGGTQAFVTAPSLSSAFFLQLHQERCNHADQVVMPWTADLFCNK
jgi:hypothetical protein